MASYCLNSPETKELFESSQVQCRDRMNPMLTCHFVPSLHAKSASDLPLANVVWFKGSKAINCWQKGEQVTCEIKPTTPALCNSAKVKSKGLISKSHFPPMWAERGLKLDWTEPKVTQEDQTWQPVENRGTQAQSWLLHGHWISHLILVSRISTI